MFITEERTKTWKIAFLLSLFSPSLFTSFFGLSFFLCLSTSCQLMRTCRWLVMNSDEHMGKICVCVHELLLQDLQPSLSQPDTPASPWEETSWLCQQRRLEPALPEERPHLWGDEAHLGREGHLKTEEEKKLIQGFGKGIKEIQLDQECKEKKKPKCDWKQNIFYSGSLGS